VRISGDLADEDFPEWMPPLPSKHDRLWAGLGASHDSWSVAALRGCLEAVRDRVGAEVVSVTDAWVDGDDAFCVIYTPPWGAMPLVGIRRERADIQRGKVEGDDIDLGVGILGAYSGFDDDPEGFGYTVVDWEMSEPLGNQAEHLRFDDSGLGWLGSLNQELPARPNVDPED
jgi:hypothetical protein